MAVIHSGINAFGRVGIHRFNDPVILILINLLQTVSFRYPIQFFRFRQMGFDKGIFFRRKHCLRHRMDEYTANGFVMDDLRPEGADQTDTAILYRLNKIRNRIIIIHNVTGYRPAVNHIHRMSRRRPEFSVFIDHLTDIANLRFNALFAKMPPSVIHIENVIQHFIFVHCAGPIGIKLTEFKITIFFIIEDINAAHRNRLRISRWQKNQRFQFL